MALPQEKGWMRVADAAKALGLGTSTLNRMRISGTGPEYIRLGRAIWYEPEAIEKWFTTLRRSQTSGAKLGIPRLRTKKAA